MAYKLMHKASDGLRIGIKDNLPTAVEELKNGHAKLVYFIGKDEEGNPVTHGLEVKEDFDTVFARLNTVFSLKGSK